MDIKRENKNEFIGVIIVEKINCNSHIIHNAGYSDYTNLLFSRTLKFIALFNFQKERITFKAINNVPIFF